MEKNQNSSTVNKALRYYFVTGALEGLVFLIYFLLIPPDPKNAWFLGYSKTRIVASIGLFGIICLFIGATILIWRKSSLSQYIVDKTKYYIDEYQWFIPIMIIVTGGSVLGPYIYLLAQPLQEDIIVRLSPFVYLGTTRVVQTLFVFFYLYLTSRTTSRGDSEQAFIIEINTKKVIVILTAIAIWIVLANFAGNFIDQVSYNPKVFRIMNKFYLDRESNLPTYFSSTLLLLSASLLGFIAILKNRGDRRYTSHWLVLSFILLYLSIDEASQIHELLNKPVRMAFDTSGTFYFAWVIPAFIAVVIVAISYFRFLLHLPKKTGVQFALGGLIYVSGAIGGELLSAWYIANYSNTNLTYYSISSLEETLEIVGVIVFIYGLLEYIRKSFQGQRFLIKEEH